MSDDRLQRGLDAYADALQRSAPIASAAQIRHRAARRRRNRVAGAALLIVMAGLGTILNRAPDDVPPPVGPSLSPSPTSTVWSDVTQLGRFGIDLEADVLIDVADDAVDHWMQVRADGTVDFTGSVKDDSTRMLLAPAPVTGRNLVVVTAPAAPGLCVAATAQPPLALVPCVAGDEAQTWRVVPAGDSGQFNLEGTFGVMTVDEALVPAGQTGGRTGLQTIRFEK